MSSFDDSHSKSSDFEDEQDRPGLNPEAPSEKYNGQLVKMDVRKAQGVPGRLTFNQKIQSFSCGCIPTNGSELKDLDEEYMANSIEDNDDDCSASVSNTERAKSRSDLKNGPEMEEEKAKAMDAARIGQEFKRNTTEGENSGKSETQRGGMGSEPNSQNHKGELASSLSAFSDSGSQNANRNALGAPIDKILIEGDNEIDLNQIEAVWNLPLRSMLSSDISSKASHDMSESLSMDLTSKVSHDNDRGKPEMAVIKATELTSKESQDASEIPTESNSNDSSVSKELAAQEEENAKNDSNKLVSPKSHDSICDKPSGSEEHATTEEETKKAVPEVEVSFGFFV